MDFYFFLIRFICINSLICILKSSISSCEYIIGMTLMTLSGSIISNFKGLLLFFLKGYYYFFSHMCHGLLLYK